MIFGKYFFKKTMNEKDVQSQNQSSDQTQTPQRKIGRFKASMMITKESWEILKQDKEMMLFPILSSIASLVLMGLVGTIVFFVTLSGDFKNIESMEGASYGFELIVAFLVYFVTFFVTIFFQTGIITIVKGRLNGQDLTFGDGMRSALNKIGKIAKWSLVASTVGVVLKTISDHSEILGRIVVAIMGAAWNVLTFFIAPILIVEDLTIKESLEKSVSTIKKVWGEAVIVNVGVGLFFGILFLIGFLAYIPLIFTGNVTILIVAAIALAIYAVILTIISSVLSVIFKVVLYEYASTGNVPRGFSKEAIDMAFGEKRRRKAFRLG